MDNKEEWIDAPGVRAIPIYRFLRASMSQHTTRTVKKEAPLRSPLTNLLGFVVPATYSFDKIGKINTLLDNGCDDKALPTKVVAESIVEFEIDRGFINQAGTSDHSLIPIPLNRARQCDLSLELYSRLLIRAATSNVDSAGKKT
jgi:hypothetical protein